MKTYFLLVMSILVAPAFAQQREDDDATSQPSTDASEVRRGQDTSLNREERTRAFFERIIAKVEPSLHGDVNNMSQYLELFKREFVEDPRTFATSLHYGITGDAKAAVDGYVEFQEHKDALAAFFKHLKLPDVVDQTELLPSADLGERKFAVVTASVAPIWDRPGTPETKRERVTTTLQGETLYLLKATDDHFLCHAPSGYVGFVAAKDVKPIDGKRLSDIESAISLQRGSQIETMLASAHKVLGTKYVWGGVSPEGIDCSGLVYSSFKTIGIQMPRDADQQYLVGRLVATRWHRELMRRGDLLFFLSRNGTVSHVAIYLGDNKFIEASGIDKPGKVRITSFNPNDKEYSERRVKTFVYAKRVIE